MCVAKSILKFSGLHGLASNTAPGTEGQVTDTCGGNQILSFGKNTYISYNCYAQRPLEARLLLGCKAKPPAAPWCTGCIEGYGLRANYTRISSESNCKS